MGREKGGQMGTGPNPFVHWLPYSFLPSNFIYWMPALSKHPTTGSALGTQTWARQFWLSRNSRSHRGDDMSALILIKSRGYRVIRHIRDKALWEAPWKRHQVQLGRLIKKMTFDLGLKGREEQGYWQKQLCKSWEEEEWRQKCRKCVVVFGCRVAHVTRRLRNKEGQWVWTRPQRTFHSQLKMPNFTLWITGRRTGTSSGWCFWKINLVCWGAGGIDQSVSLV